MRRLSPAVLGLAGGLHERYGAALLAVKRATGRLRPLTVVAYRGYGTADGTLLKGRVLERTGVTGAHHRDTLADNVVNVLRRFTASPIPGATVRLGPPGEPVTATTDAEGYWRAAVRPPSGEPLGPGWHDVEVALTSPPSRGGRPVRATGRVLVPVETARIAVISDLDDTVVRSEATDTLMAARILLTSNARTRIPFEGVGAFYRALRDGPDGGRDGGRGNPVFFVSSSPWNLYDLLVDFLALNGVPEGPLQLRAWGLDADAVPTGGHEDHKLAAVREILSTYPRLDVVLIGDSGQRDPEVYARVAAEHRARVRAVYIRDVTSPARDRAVRDIADRARAAGTDFLLVPDTAAAAAHAAAHGLIDPAAVADVAADRAADRRRRLSARAGASGAGR